MQPFKQIDKQFQNAYEQDKPVHPEVYKRYFEMIEKIVREKILNLNIKK